MRRSVFIATPLGGIDTAYRWPLANVSSTTADYALAPTSWRTWCPYGVAYTYLCTDLSAQDFLPAAGDLFPGQRQILARQPYDLPGSLPWLGVYSLQTDWYIAAAGVDPRVEIDAAAADPVEDGWMAGRRPHAVRPPPRRAEVDGTLARRASKTRGYPSVAGVSARFSHIIACSGRRVLTPSSQRSTVARATRVRPAILAASSIAS